MTVSGGYLFNAIALGVQTTSDKDTRTEHPLDAHDRTLNVEKSHVVSGSSNNRLCIVR